MQIQQNYKITGHVILGEDITDENHEKFYIELEKLMNDNKIFYCEAFMNPYGKTIVMKDGI